MKRVLLIISIVSLLVACSSKPEKNDSSSETIIENKQQDVDPNAPDWYNKPPKSDDYVYGIGLGSSSDRSTSERKAVMQANIDLAEQISPSRTEDGKSSTEANLVNVIIEKKVCKKEKSKFNTYVLLKMKK